MRQKNKTKRRLPKTVLRLPDLDHSKSSVLQSLGSTASQRTYGFAIDDFISWYCSEPRLAFGRAVVLRYCYYLESRQLHFGHSEVARHRWMGHATMSSRCQCASINPFSATHWGQSLGFARLSSVGTNR